MGDSKHIKIKDWSEFEDDLRTRLTAMGFKRMICIRNYFSTRASIALATGTDRDAKSDFWNVQGFDYNHANGESGKRADEIVYVHRINWHTKPFTTLNLGEEYSASYKDMTETLDEGSAVSVYDSVGLDREASNEHWFNRAPLDTLLFVYSIDEDVDD